jgi:hypothetical protein
MGCDTGFHVNNGEDDSVQTDSRTAVPVNPGFAYTLTFTAPGKT